MQVMEAYILQSSDLRFHPAYESSTTGMRKELLDLLAKLYPQINPNFYFRKSFTIGSFF